MLADRFNANKSASAPSALTAAREAYLNSDLTACFAALDMVPNTSQADRREAVLLRSRVLLRLHRHGEVVELLGPALKTFVGVDEECTARMLHAVAIARGGAVERGLSLLRELDESARGRYAHPTICAETAYWIAFVNWLQRDYVAAAKSAAIAESAGADVVSVRAASLRGFIAVAQEQYGRALELFSSALSAYRLCHERDVDLAERLVHQIASLEVTLRSAQIPGTHSLPSDEGRIGSAVRRGVPGSGRTQIAALDAWLYTLDGNKQQAYRCVRVAEDLAPTTAWRMWALAGRASVALAFDDVAIAGEFAQQAIEIVESVEWNATADEERVGLLLLAEVLATTMPLAAVSTFTQYSGLSSELDRSLLFRSDVRLWIEETFVRGLVHRIRGESAEAADAFRQAHIEAKRIGCLWRAAMALIELDATPVAPRPRDEFSLEAAAKIVHEHFPRSFLARRLGRWMQVHVDPDVARLTRVPREVLRHLLEGYSAKEIAAVMGLSPGTVKNYVNGILREFGVRSTPQLLVTCYRRGLGTPSWDAPPARSQSSR